ncbi:hypothetical protein BM1_10760 [Bipolaris maydis]|nr:hypothetical protein BM1_10760 [Bipolaris maydis]
MHPSRPPHHARDAYRTLVDYASLSHCGPVQPKRRVNARLCGYAPDSSAAVFAAMPADPPAPRSPPMMPSSRLASPLLPSSARSAHSAHHARSARSCSHCVTAHPVLVICPGPAPAPGQQMTDVQI